MKKIILGSLIFIVSLITSTIAAHEKSNKVDKVPQNVIDGFKGKYPDAMVKKWMKENEVYIAKYKQNREIYEATFNAQGKWMKTAKTIQWEDLPDVDKIAFENSFYKDWTVFGITQINYVDGTTNYALVVDDANQYSFVDQDYFKAIYKVYFSSQGKFEMQSIQYNYNLF